MARMGPTVPRRARGARRRAVPLVRTQLRCRVRSGSLEGVLHLLAGLLEVALGLVGLALGLEVLVVRGLADGFLGLAHLALGEVLGLVLVTHEVSPSLRGVSDTWPVTARRGSQPSGQLRLVPLDRAEDAVDELRRVV